MPQFHTFREFFPYGLSSDGFKDLENEQKDTVKRREKDSQKEALTFVKNAFELVICVDKAGNAQQKKSFFIRYGAGSPRSLAAAIRLSAELLVSHLERHRTSRGHADNR